jgi:hypothetical protein
MTYEKAAGLKAGPAQGEQMNKRIWILGAPDPEMSEIEALLREQSETVAYATVDGVRVHPGNAYRADCPAVLQAGGLPASGDGITVVAVECDWDHAFESTCAVVVRVDHHRPGDPGYGRAAADYLPGSSIGQVIALLVRAGRLGDVTTRTPLGVRWKFEPRAEIAPGLAVPAHWRINAPVDLTSSTADAAVEATYVVPGRLAMVAAADHCLAAAYAGKCPGVDPEELKLGAPSHAPSFSGARSATCSPTSKRRG